MVYTVCVRVLRHREEAEEATQDTFVKAYQNLAGYQGGAKFSTWLYSIAFRTAISQQRKHRNPSLSLEDIQGNEHAIRPEDPSDARDRKVLLEKALSALDPEDSALMTMFYLDELSVEEIVTVTSWSTSNVKVKLHRCRKRMFDILKDQLKEEVWTLNVD